MSKETSLQKVGRIYMDFGEPSKAVMMLFPGCLRISR